MAIRSWSYGWVALACVLPLLACVPGAEVKVEQRAGLIDISVARLHKTKAPCVERLAVYPGEDEAAAIWLIVRTDDSICLNRFSLGNVPKGFDVDGGAKPPLPGVKYQVSVLGVGLNARTTFVVGGPDGVISRD